ncbi:hypothetical protein [Streptomyces sp. NPDC048419]|uniref:hypothetical protein n=1 Tax=Streptomyces sp. NPDC048419 TaxID=3365547 RepID=UPI003711B3C2
MRIRIAVAATALGALVVFGGAAAAAADTGDEGTSSQVDQDWQGPAFDDQPAAGLGTEGDLDLGQKDSFGGADATFLK